jgi:hypothetical protein
MRSFLSGDAWEANERTAVKPELEIAEPSCDHDFQASLYFQEIFKGTKYFAKRHFRPLSSRKFSQWRILPNHFPYSRGAHPQEMARER